MSSASAVSVALCSRNGERFIEEQIVSILAQTAPPREIVVSDDASDDNTVRLIRDAVDKYHLGTHVPIVGLKVIENAVPLGVTKNFEQAIAACTSEFIALCDQDDVWEPERLRRASSVFDSRPDLRLLHSDAHLIDESGALFPESLFEALGITQAVCGSVHAGRAFSVLMKRNIVTGATTMLRRDLALQAMPFPAPWLHDEWLAIIGAATGEVDLVADRLIKYRQHGANQIGARKPAFAEKARRILAPGSGRNQRLLARATSLAERLGVMEGVPGKYREAARQKREHELVRSSLGSHRTSRVLPIARELWTGRYGKFGRGLTDAIRDQLQPLT